MAPRAESPRETVLTPVDLRLLAALEHERNMVRACRTARISRDRGTYRIRRLERILNKKVLRTRSGRGRTGTSMLTPTGRNLLHRGRGSYTLGEEHPQEPANSMVFRGIWSGRGGPQVRVNGAARFWVGFLAAEGATVTVAIDPEVVLVARRKIVTSARNTFSGKIRSIERIDAPRRRITIAAGGMHLSAVVTPHSIRALKLRRGVPVVLYIKATGLRRLS